MEQKRKKEMMLKPMKNGHDGWELIMKVLTEKIPEHDVVFQSWLNEDTENDKLYQMLKGEVQADAVLDKDKTYGYLSERLSFGKKTPFFSIKNRLRYVAAIFLLFSAGITFYIVYDKYKVTNGLAQTEAQNTIFSPGNKKAFLQSQGQTIDLTREFQLENEDGTVISNNLQGVVTFEKNKEKVNKEDVIYHTLNVPKGGEYELILADGSKVFLNSETIITFPSRFDEDTREVKLIGEAFFEIQKSTKPFIVQTANTNIKVLGTTFNVSAYKDEAYTTTLVEGSVRIYTSDEEAADSFLLKPGQNLFMDTSSEKVLIQKVDTDIYTAWVKGKFIFKNQSLDEILNRLSRWYDFTIEYEDPRIKQMKFTGSAEKARTLDYLLNLIEAVTDVRYRSEGNKIIMHK